ncbi:uncharacterized protein K452DRAFT_306601 [Aplosporella prunicola CBS 121167]|uniref:Tc1-like transposase DDE domain-containing protein n=1 Tax=Aplosporella prunicola CBS 121167 TaxID=1176127 RepID=A0A6A6BKW0_9PEZI|nr:uncharacterized protein K452DRAFT_306601 [Aplosporella prunicola CBS 121167]KAF2143955.1 hypothetical protein K452DRAFT_306601 [Aplosporella prunicola CBS 121167]
MAKKYRKKKRDPELKKNGISSRSYIKVLKEAILINLEPDMLFIQDNSLIYTAKRVKFELLLYSPDLNPQENLWFPLKAKLNELRPDLLARKGDPEAIEAEIAEWLPRA